LCESETHTVEGACGLVDINVVMEFAMTLPSHESVFARKPYKRFSGPIRALPPERAGIDAWRATTYGHGVFQANPHGAGRWRLSTAGG